MSCAAAGETATHVAKTAKIHVRAMALLPRDLFRPRAIAEGICGNQFSLNARAATDFTDSTDLRNVLVPRQICGIGEICGCLLALWQPLSARRRSRTVPENRADG